MSNFSNNSNSIPDPLNVMDLEAFVESFPEIDTHRKIILTLIDTAFDLGATKESLPSSQGTFEQKEKYSELYKQFKDHVNQVLGPRLNTLIQLIVAKKLSQTIDLLSKELKGVKTNTSTT